MQHRFWSAFLISMYSYSFMNQNQLLLQIAFKHILELQSGNKSFCSLFFIWKLALYILLSFKYFLWCNLEFFQKSLNFSSKSPHIAKSSQKSLIYSPFPLISFNFWLLKACGNPVDINSKFSELSCEVYVFFLKIIQLNVSVNVTIIIAKKIVENWPFGWCHFSGPCF